MQISFFARFWLLLGIALFAGCLGFLTGASSTPVVGAFLTATLGALASLGGIIPVFLRKTDAASPSDTAIPMNAILALSGQIMFVFAVSLAGSTWLGINKRLAYIEEEERKLRVEQGSTFGELPWDENNKPRNGQEAIDWCVTQASLINIGLNRQQISDIYLIYRSSTEKNDSTYQPPNMVPLAGSVTTPKPALPREVVPSPPPYIPKKVPPGLQDWQKSLVPSKIVEKTKVNKQ